MTNIEKTIFEMLTENTGSHMLDSGGAYGRNWERNQKKTLADFQNEPETEYFIDKDGYVERYVSVFHYLTMELSIDKTCEEFNAINTKADNWDGEAYGLSSEGEKFLKNKGFSIDDSWNTYNYGNDLSQVIQGTWVNEGEYVLIQIHGGCDVRGGYTDARLFKCPEDMMLNRAITEYMDEYELEDELEYIEFKDRDTEEVLSESEVKKRWDKRSN